MARNFSTLIFRTCVMQSPHKIQAEFYQVFADSHQMLRIPREHIVRKKEFTDLVSFDQPFDFIYYILRRTKAYPFFGRTIQRFKGTKLQ